ncbi:MAG: hypothetical protein CVU87_00880 [Firmicutes bacterium HGW-Firmicutes-12]|jgi:uncharacterized protein YceK|nr:MAG: hypothetical protein CVU87_00880 [Firmicutes bacterium HGW-Firmicutes-12]
MKKLIIVPLAALLLLSGCGADTAATKTGLGHVISIQKSADATAEKEGLAQVDAVMAAATFDADGKIIAVEIDNAQVKVNFDESGIVTTDKTVAPQTKVELGDKYGLIKASKIGKEWYQQIDELEAWMIGKTVDEVKALKVKQVDDNHPSVPDVAELNSKVTITVQDYIAAVAEAYANAK